MIMGSERIMEMQCCRERKEGKCCIICDRSFRLYYLSPAAGVTEQYALNLKAEKYFAFLKSLYRTTSAADP